MGSANLPVTNANLVPGVIVLMSVTERKSDKVTIMSALNCCVIGIIAAISLPILLIESLHD